MNNRTVLIIGATILIVAFGLEFWYTNSNPVISYAPTGYNSTKLGQKNLFSYMKDGETIGSYEYNVTADASNQSLYTVSTQSNITYNGSHVVVNSVLRFTSSVVPRSYGVNATVDGVLSTIACNFTPGTVTIFNKSAGKNKNFSLPFATGTALIDNNNPAHWELIYRSFKPVLGKVYGLKAFVPQTATVFDYELGLDSSTRPVSIGGTTYDCIVVREPDLGVVAYFYKGQLMRFDSQNDGVNIVRVP